MIQERERGGATVAPGIGTSRLNPFRRGSRRRYADDGDEDDENGVDDEDGDRDGECEQVNACVCECAMLSSGVDLRSIVRVWLYSPICGSFAVMVWKE